jgi:hypothetical protein
MRELNKKIKTAYNFGKNYGSLRYILGYLVLRKCLVDIFS